jgi:hypothetical protein
MINVFVSLNIFQIQDKFRSVAPFSRTNSMASRKALFVCITSLIATSIVKKESQRDLVNASNSFICLEKDIEENINDINLKNNKKTSAYSQLESIFFSKLF